MRFDLKKLGFLAALFVAILVGCSGEDVSYHDVPQIKLKGSECIYKVVPDVHDYFSGLATPAQTNAIWNCFSYALKMFQKYVRGGDGVNYSTMDVRTFLEEYFLKPAHKREHIITDDLLNEMMHVKRLFLGGGLNNLTPDDIRKTFVLIEDFRRISLNLLPSTPLLFVRDSSEMPSDEKFSQSEEALRTSVADLMGLLSVQNANYEMSHLANLLRELHKFFVIMDPNSTFGEMDKYIPVFAATKALLLNTREELIQSSEWEPFGHLVYQCVTLILRSVYYMKTESLSSENLLEQFTRTVQLGVDVLVGGLKRRDRVPYANYEFEKVIKKMGEANMLPLEVEHEEFKSLIVLWNDTLLNPDRRFPGSGLSVSKLEYFMGQVKDWAGVQRGLLEQQLRASSGWDQLRSLLNTPWAISLDDQGRVVLDGAEPRSTNFSAITQLNWARALFDFLFKAYVKDPARIVQKGLTKKELHKAYLDLKPVLVALQLIEKDDKDFDVRLYTESGLFMPLSDGDDFVSFNEIVEYLHFVVAGIKAGDLYIAEADKSCDLDEKTFDVKCFRRDLPAQAGRYLKHLPFYLKYSDGIGRKKWETDIRSMEKINREERDADSPIKKSDVYESFILLEYIENTMLRFDEDRSGDIDLKEAFKMLKLYKNIIAGIIGLNPEGNKEDEEQLETIFTYMLNYGEFPVPDENHPLDELRFLNWQMQKGRWKLAANRGMLLKILASFQRLKPDSLDTSTKKFR